MIAHVEGRDKGTDLKMEDEQRKMEETAEETGTEGKCPVRRDTTRGQVTGTGEGETDTEADQDQGRDTEAVEIDDAGPLWLTEAYFKTVHGLHIPSDLACQGFLYWGEREERGGEMSDWLVILVSLNKFLPQYVAEWSSGREWTV